MKKRRKLCVPYNITTFTTHPYDVNKLDFTNNFSIIIYHARTQGRKYVWRRTNRFHDSFTSRHNRF